MKLFFKVILVWFAALTVLSLSLLSLSRVNAAGRETPPGIGSTAGSPYFEVLDDFNTGTSRDCFASGNGVITSPCPIIDNQVIISYDVSITPASAWLPITLNNMDLSNWDVVWIAIRGEVGGEEVLAEFTDCGNTVFPKVKISQYITGGISTTWHAAAIPLSDFTEITDWSCIDRFSIVANSDVPSGKGTVYVDNIMLLAPTVLIDDFHDAQPSNRLMADSGPWTSTNSVIITHTFPGVLKLEYDVPSGDFGGGYWTKVLSTNLVSLKKYLSFKVKGQVGGEEMAVEVVDCGLNGPRHYPKIKVSDYLERGLITTEQTVVIPLAAFVDEQFSGDAGVDWTCIEQFAFNLSGLPEINSGSGTILIDNVKLVPANALPYRIPIWVDRFHDCNEQNALMWPWNQGTGAGGSLTVVTDTINRRGDYGCSYHFIFDTESFQSAWVYTELKGLDVTDYTYLEFYIKGKAGTTDETTHVYLVDRQNNGNGPDDFIPITPTTDWRRILIPLSKFRDDFGVDLTDLRELKFAFERVRRQGEVYVDDISFIRPWVGLPFILNRPPTNLSVRNKNTGGDVKFTVDTSKEIGVDVSCTVPNNETKPCGPPFPAGVYTVWITAKCGNSQLQISFPPGDVLKTVICP